MSEVFIVLTWLRGDLDEIVPYASLVNAEQAAASLLAEKLPELHKELSKEHDLGEWSEFMGNLLQLFAQEAYAKMLECWEEWVEDCEGSAPFNVVIEQREVKP